ncbi:Inner membrane transport permease yadH [Providencia rustigianii]|nr:Inner membrane transport permease yadH [Providencia rustigianii]
MFSLYWVALKTIWIKEVTRFGRIWVQTLLPPVITMSLYFVIFGNLIGSRIGEMGGVDYMQFIVPGLIMMAVITNSYSNVCSSFFGSKFQKNIEELLVAPVPTHVIIAGFVGGGGCPWYFSWLFSHGCLIVLYSTTSAFMVNGRDYFAVNCNCIFPCRVTERYLC